MKCRSPFSLFLNSLPSLDAERGVSEVAQIILILMVSLIALLTAGTVLKSDEIQTLNQSRYQVSLKILGSQFISSFRNEDALNLIYSHSDNAASVAELKSCRESSDCDHDSTGNISVLFNGRGDKTYDQGEPNKGFNHLGEPCEFLPDDPDSAFECPIYINMSRWLARCPEDSGGGVPATCTAPNIYLQVTFAVRENVTRELRIRLNPFNTIASAKPIELP